MYCIDRLDVLSRQISRAVDLGRRRISPINSRDVSAGVQEAPRLKRAGGGARSYFIYFFECDRYLVGCTIISPSCLQAINIYSCTHDVPLFRGGWMKKRSGCGDV